MDLVDFPPVIANRVLKRQPLNIVYVRKHLALRKRLREDSSPLPHPLPPPNYPPEDDEAQFEDALPVSAFTKDSWLLRRSFSDPTAKES